MGVGGEVAAIGQLTSALENNEAPRVTSNLALACIIARYIYIIAVYICMYVYTWCLGVRGRLFRSAN